VCPVRNASGTAIPNVLQIAKLRGKRKRKESMYQIKEEARARNCLEQPVFQVVDAVATVLLMGQIISLRKSAGQHRSGQAFLANKSRSSPNQVWPL